MDLEGRISHKQKQKTHKTSESYLMETSDYEFCEILYKKIVNNIILIDSDNKKLSINNVFDLEIPQSEETSITGTDPLIVEPDTKKPPQQSKGIPLSISPEAIQDVKLKKVNQDLQKSHSTNTSTNRLSISPEAIQGVKLRKISDQTKESIVPTTIKITIYKQKNSDEYVIEGTTDKDIINYIKEKLFNNETTYEKIYKYFIDNYLHNYDPEQNTYVNKTKIEYVNKYLPINVNNKQFNLEIRLYKPDAKIIQVQNNVFIDMADAFQKMKLRDSSSDSGENEEESSEDSEWGAGGYIEGGEKLTDDDLKNIPKTHKLIKLTDFNEQINMLSYPAYKIFKIYISEFEKSDNINKKLNVLYHFDYLIQKLLYMLEENGYNIQPIYDAIIIVKDNKLTKILKHLYRDYNKYDDETIAKTFEIRNGISMNCLKFMYALILCEFDNNDKNDIKSIIDVNDFMIFLDCLSPNFHILNSKLIIFPVIDIRIKEFKTRLDVFKKIINDSDDIEDSIKTRFFIIDTSYFIPFLNEITDMNKDNETLNKIKDYITKNNTNEPLYEVVNFDKELENINIQLFPEYRTWENYIKNKKPEIIYNCDYDDKKYVSKEDFTKESTKVEGGNSNNRIIKITNIFLYILVFIFIVMIIVIIILYLKINYLTSMKYVYIQQLN